MREIQFFYFFVHLVNCVFGAKIQIFSGVSIFSVKMLEYDAYPNLESVNCFSSVTLSSVSNCKKMTSCALSYYS